MDIAVSPDSQRMASVGDDGTVRVWNLRNPFPRRFQAHDSTLRRLGLSKSGKLLVSFETSDLGSKVKIWSVPKLELLHELVLDYSVNRAIFNDKNQVILGTHGNGTDAAVRRWDPSKQKHPVTILNSSTASAFDPIALTPNGRRFGYAHVADREHHDPLPFLLGNLNESIETNTTPNKRTQSLNGHKWQIYDAAFSSNGQYLATVGRDRVLNVWDANQGKLIYSKTIKGTTEALHCVAISNDSGYLATGAADGLVILRSLSDGKELARFRHNVAITGIQFMSDGETLVTCSGSDKTIKLWDIETGLLRTSLLGHDGFVQSLVCTPDDSYILSGDSTGHILVWDGREPDELRKEACQSTHPRARCP